MIFDIFYYVYFCGYVVNCDHVKLTEKQQHTVKQNKLYMQERIQDIAKSIKRHRELELIS